MMVSFYGGGSATVARAAAIVHLIPAHETSRMAGMSSPRAYYDNGSLHIETYDSIYTPLPDALLGDIGFYCALARRRGGPPLRVGCGTRRGGLAAAPPPLAGT